MLKKNWYTNKILRIFKIISGILQYKRKKSDEFILITINL